MTQSKPRRRLVEHGLIGSGGLSECLAEAAVTNIGSDGPPAPGIHVPTLVCEHLDAAVGETFAMGVDGSAIVLGAGEGERPVYETSKRAESRYATLRAKHCRAAGFAVGDTVAFRVREDDTVRVERVPEENATWGEGDE